MCLELTFRYRVYLTLTSTSVALHKCRRIVDLHYVDDDKVKPLLLTIQRTRDEELTRPSVYFELF